MVCICAQYTVSLIVREYVCVKAKENRFLSLLTKLKWEFLEV